MWDRALKSVQCLWVSLWDYMNPALLWLCGLVRCRASYGTWALPWSLSHWKSDERGDCYPWSCTASARQQSLTKPQRDLLERRGHFEMLTVFVLVFVGLLGPCTTLVLWLGWMQSFLSGPDHSVIKSKTRVWIAILEAAQHWQDGNQTTEKIAREEGKLCKLVQCLCLSLWDYLNPVLLWLYGLVGCSTSYRTWTLALITQSLRVR